MFRCEHCNTNVESGRPSRQVVIEIRPRTYAPPERKTKSRGWRRAPRPEPTPLHGWEIAQSARVCNSCATELETRHTQAVAQLDASVPTL